MRRAALALILLAGCSSSSSPTVGNGTGTNAAPAPEQPREVEFDRAALEAAGGLAYFAGGCFWGVEHFLEQLDGVFRVESGYMGGHVDKPTYEDVSSQTSGHLDWYKENMYSGMEIEGQQYIVKPMNCPFHITMFQKGLRSYKQLPFRWAELGTVYRYERSGVLHGLLRVRGFTQDDAHLFMTREQLPGELHRVVEFCLYILRTFGFTDFKLYLATRPAKFVGDPELWAEAEKALLEVLQKSGLQRVEDTLKKMME